MADNHGRFAYPGIVAYDSVQVTDIAGIQPATFCVEVYPQSGIPEHFGDITLTYNDQTIVYKNCALDSASIQKNSGGQIISCRFLDERWSWKYGQITGKYNFKLPNNFVDSRHEKTPKELAALLFAALGVSDFDTSVLPDDARTEVDWVCANPAEELAKMCDDLGCRIVPKRSSGAWVICLTGKGAEMPDYLPYCDGGEGIDPKEITDFIQVVTAEIRYQVALRIDPIGKDTDLSWRDIGDLSYCPNQPQNVNGQFVDQPAKGFCFEPRMMGNISAERVLLGDGTKISPRELAVQTVFKCWRISVSDAKRTGRKGVDDDPAIWIDGFEGYVTRKQIILSDQLVQSWTDDRGQIHRRPSFLWGSFEAAFITNDPPNYPNGTRIDYQGAMFKESEEERASFSLALDPIDTDRSIVTTSKQMRFITTTTVGAETLTVYDTAHLFYTSAINIRDPVTWQPVRYFRTRQIGTGSDATKVWTIVKNDIQPWVTCLYNDDGTFSSKTDNEDEVKIQCEFYLDQIIRTIETISTSMRTYIGLFAIDMDGAIQQVSYRIGPQGHDTMVSRGTEHNFDLPDYEARRQRDGRHNIAEKMALRFEIAERANALKGTFNT